MPTTPTTDEFEVKLARYLNAHPRLWDQRFFRAQVIQVTAWGSGFLCSVQRTGSATPEVNQFLCMSYTPAVGDDVECMWRDEQTGYVLCQVPT